MPTADLIPLHKATPADVQAACAKIPPLWPLEKFVAVNPFVGMTSLPFAEVCKVIQQVTHSSLLMPPAFYLQAIKDGQLTQADLNTALEKLKQQSPTPWDCTLFPSSINALSNLLADLENHPEKAALPTPILTVTDAADKAFGTRWSSFVAEEISKWCAAHYDQGQALWESPWKEAGIYAAWKKAAGVDFNPEAAGLAGFRKQVAALPDDPMKSIIQITTQLGVQSSSAPQFLHRQLASIAGWSGYVQYLVRENSMIGVEDDSLIQLLAIRMAYESVFFSQYRNDKFALIWEANLNVLSSSGTPEAEIQPDYVQVLNLCQLASEAGFQRRFIAQLQSGAPISEAKVLNSDAELSEKGSEEPPALQAVFCIDVRSELYRRSLEALSPEIETIGFAGFFGFPIEYIPLGLERGSAQCPVLLTPKVRIREGLRSATAKQDEHAVKGKLFAGQLGTAWNSFKGSAASCFSFVETSGLLFAPKLIKETPRLGERLQRLCG